ncbi:glycosyltransferase [Cohnella ginsengisoli]
MDDLVSIVIPVFNAEEYLAEAMESIINQSYKKN